MDCDDPRYVAAGEPDWAPSDRIAFTRSDTPDLVVETGSIATIAPDGTRFQDVTPVDGGNAIEPTWVDGTRLMFVGHADGRMHLVTANADGSNQIVAKWSLRGPSGHVVRTHAHLRPTPPTG